MSSSNMFLNSVCLSKFIEARGRNMNVLSKQKRPNAMKKCYVLNLSSKIRDTYPGMAHIICFE